MESKLESNKNIMRALKGSLISIIITILLLLIYAILLTYTSISESTMVPVIVTISGISILIGSTVSSFKIKKHGMLNGGIVGLIYILFIYILSSILLTGFAINISSIIMILASIIAGMIGGVIGVNL